AFPLVSDNLQSRLLGHGCLTQQPQQLITSGDPESFLCHLCRHPYRGPCRGPCRPCRCPSRRLCRLCRLCSLCRTCSLCRRLELLIRRLVAVYPTAIELGHSLDRWAGGVVAVA